MRCWKTRTLTQPKEEEQEIEKTEGEMEGMEADEMNEMDVKKQVDVEKEADVEREADMEEEVEKPEGTIIVKL